MLVMGWVETNHSGIIFDQCQELNGHRVVQGFSVRISGNMALHIGDDPNQVVARRESWLKALSLRLEQLVAGIQVHGTRVALIEKTAVGSGAFNIDGAIPETDALVTREPGIILATFTADCIPIFIYDPVTPAIGVVHAGWRGTIQGIAAITVKRMVDEFGTNPGDCLVAIGPSICGDCYRVDRQLAERFGEIHTQVVTEDELGYRIDLQTFNRLDLMGIGVCASHIYEAHRCTNCQPERYFSYRADHGKTGRMMGIIALKESIVNGAIF